MVSKRALSIPVKPVKAASPRITIENPRLHQLQQRVAIASILLPLVGTGAAIASLWLIGLQPSIIVLTVICYTFAFAGMTVGLHRYLSHKAFATGRFVHAFWLILGSMAAQGPPINWVAVHRRHHQYSDRPEDPHSPHMREQGSLKGMRGFWHSYMGWMLTSKVTNPALFAKDMMRDPLTVKINKLYFWWVGLSLVIPTILGGLITLSWIGALQGFLWAGLVRMFLVQHFTWSIAVVGHRFGTRPFNNRDHSSNNIWLAILNLGESWHNNHHAFPQSPVIGLEWWQIDIGGWMIRSMEFFGIAWDLKVPKRSLVKSRESRSSQ